MTKHVNIGDAKTRLSELVAAAVRGEDVILDKAGLPQVRLVPVDDAVAAHRAAVVQRRLSALGMYQQRAGGQVIDVAALKLSGAEQEASYGRKFGPAN